MTLAEEFLIKVIGMLSFRLRGRCPAAGPRLLLQGQGRFRPRHRGGGAGVGADQRRQTQRARPRHAPRGGRWCDGAVGDVRLLYECLQGAGRGERQEGLHWVLSKASSPAGLDVTCTRVHDGPPSRVVCRPPPPPRPKPQTTPRNTASPPPPGTDADDRPDSPPLRTLAL